jgi:alkylation response protein AidB-like acyl-CoA dehydrogenase
VDVRLTDEQRMLQAAAASIASGLEPKSVDQFTVDTRAATEGSGWTLLVGADLIALNIAADVGGAGGRVVDAALVAEQLAARLVSVPFIGAAAWVPALLAAATAPAALEGVRNGKLRLAPVLRRDLSGLARHRDGGVAFDSQGASAGVLLGDDGALTIVELGETTRSVDLTRTLSRVEPDAERVDIGVPLGTRVDDEALQRIQAGALALLSADLLGIMQRSLDDAVAYVRTREQFGVPVGSFQAIRHLAASAAVLVEGARSSMWHAAWAADALPPVQALIAARQAKAFCSAAGRDVGETCIQMCGGIGLTWEHFAHLRQRRTLLSRRVLGDEHTQYAAIAHSQLVASEGV